MQLDERIRAPSTQRSPDKNGTRAMAATVLLADGLHFEGKAIGVDAMTGYQEALTDPSYRGQLLLFTYPLIGNYGVLPVRSQSAAVHPGGVLCSHLSPSWAGQSGLAAWLTSARVPLVYDVDTRAIALHTRRHGSMAAAVAVHLSHTAPDRVLMEAALVSCAYDETDYVSEVTPWHPAIHGQGTRTIALLDCGAKRQMIRELVQRHMRVIVLPASTSASAILALAPHAVVISNGPGNPAAVEYIVETIRHLWDRVPLFGICLGHQLVALAAGATTLKLPFGHRGANHPVMDVRSGRAFISTQNHGYAVDSDSLPDDLLVSHRNLHDGTVEGLRHRTLPIRSLQFHPEGAPGPADGAHAFDEWLADLPRCAA